MTDQRSKKKHSIAKRYEMRQSTVVLIAGACMSHLGMTTFQLCSVISISTTIQFHLHTKFAIRQQCNTGIKFHTWNKLNCNSI